MIRTVQFGPWMPDAPDYEKPGLDDALNVYPSPNGGYYPFWSATTATASVTGTVAGAKRFEQTDGTEIWCVGTDSDLYVIDSTTSNASSLALSSINTADENWTFEQFGVYIFATIKSIDADGIQTYYLTDLDSDTTFSAAPGTPPGANAMARIDDFLLFGDMEDIDNSNTPYRVRWSPYNNPIGTYGTDIATQAGYQDFPAHMGRVTGIAGGDIGLVMQKNGVSRFDAGGPSAFTRVTLSESLGCEGQASIAKAGGKVFWLSDEGFVAWDGGGLRVISTQRMWDWFLENVNRDKLNKVQAAVNWDRRCVVWNCYGTDQSAYDTQVIYSWETDSWSRAAQSLDWLHESVYDGAHSAGEMRKSRILGAFSSGTRQELSSTSLEATLETGDLVMEPGRRSFVRGIRPLIQAENAAQAQASVGYRNEPGTAITYETDTTVHNGQDFAPFNTDGRFVRARIKVPAGQEWDKAIGFEIDADPSGIT